MASTLLSQRRERFYKLVQAAYAQTTDWLIQAMKNRQENHMRPLAQLACLRVLAFRDPSGLPYPQRKRLVRKKLGI